MIKRKTVILCMLLLGISVSGCGKTREVDEASSKVIQISVAPEETSPTPAPDQVASAAVTTNGNLTMVNTYLAEQDAAGISSAESSDSQSDADSTDNSVDSADNNEQDSSTSDTEEYKTGHNRSRLQWREGISQILPWKSISTFHFA